MSSSDKRYAVYWALAGIARPGTTYRFLRDRRAADRAWLDFQAEKLEGLGSVTRLSILPLVEFYASDPRLATEAGVSYLVTVDGKKLLFDVGFNARDEHPSPLLRNLNTLGVAVDEIDAVFISHPHLDHVGGRAQQTTKTFALSREPVDLRGIPAYVPAQATHPSAHVEVIAGPRPLDRGTLGPGLASSGPIPRAIWLMGTVLEHALLVNVAEKGVVMIVGCGHPSLERLIERAQRATGEPLYGVVGGLHFPATGSRVGKGRQNIIGNGKLPWQRVTRAEVRAAAARLTALDLGLVALSAHDSCDWTLRQFEDALGDRYRTLKVGEEIVIS
jgi:7,8-dihydropterin-6-yl-methyl-4-(beta-D-ribofuranosyl)aminobenzene 5'-phosphate synthase